MIALRELSFAIEDDALSAAICERYLRAFAVTEIASARSLLVRRYARDIVHFQNHLRKSRPWDRRNCFALDLLACVERPACRAARDESRPRREIEIIRHRRDVESAFSQGGNLLA